MKKQQQLGMNPSTASHRLVKDTLWRLIESGGHNLCYRCGQPMSRETFSIEHKEAWLDSKDPIGLYFDQDNVGFSHMVCNRAASKGRTIHETDLDRKAADAARKRTDWANMPVDSRKESRRLRYERYGY